MNKIQDMIRLAKASGACNGELKAIKRQFKEGMTGAQFVEALKDHEDARFWVHWLTENGIIPSHFVLDFNRIKDALFTEYLREFNKEGATREYQDNAYQHWIAADRKAERKMLSDFEAWLNEGENGKQLQSSEVFPPLG